MPWMLIGKILIYSYVFTKTKFAETDAQKYKRLNPHHTNFIFMQKQTPTNQLVKF